MDNQMPYGYGPNMQPKHKAPMDNNCHCMREIREINRRLENLERRVTRVERRLSNIPMPIRNDGSDQAISYENPMYPNDNYML